MLPSAQCGQGHASSGHPAHLLPAEICLVTVSVYPSFQTLSSACFLKFCPRRLVSLVLRLPSPRRSKAKPRGRRGAGMCLAAGLARQNRQKLTKRGALCYDGDRRCQIRQAVSTSRKGGDAHGYIRRADPDRYFDREHLQSGLSDLQKEMTAPAKVCGQIL